MSRPSLVSSIALACTMFGTGCGDPCLDDGPGSQDQAGELCPVSNAPEGGRPDDTSTDDTNGEGETAGDTTYCRDADMDGFGDSADCMDAPSAPPGYVEDDTDCDDANANAFPGAAEDEDIAACMQDDDMDGWGDTDPSGPNTTPGTDCDDDAATTFPGAAPNDSATACMKDADGDDWGDDDASSMNPAIEDGTDCDDDSASASATFPGAAPNNSDTACMKDVDDDDWGDNTPSEPGVVGGTDCDDDDDASATDCSPTKTVCQDLDADGYGDPLVCMDILPLDPVPAGFVEDNTDCDDSLATGVDVFPGSAENESPPGICMEDNDDDGWGDANPESTGAVPGTDCDDDGVDAATTFPGAAQNENAPGDVACMKDADMDGYGDAAPATGGVTPGTDCDDADATSATTCGTQIVCIDVDGDNFGDAANCIGILPTDPVPPGYAGNDTDCDDSLATGADVFPGSAENESPPNLCMEDSDDDGWGDADPESAAAVPGNDCDDDSADAAATYPGSAEVDSITQCMKDGDDDGYGDDAPTYPGVVGGTDCDDDSAFAANTFPGAAENNSSTACMKDDDMDGYGDSTPAEPGVSPGTDCDDADAGSLASCGSLVVCLDADGDTFGDTFGCIGILPGDPVPVGYVNNNGDCWDAAPDGAQTFPGAAENESGTACMKDNDLDGYGDSDPVSQGAPVGVVAGVDCDDSDADTWAFTEPGDLVAACYEDKDGDGFGDTNPTNPAAVGGTDCDDDSADAGDTFPGNGENEVAPGNTACMKDSDMDGYGDGAPTAGGVTAGTDCDDGDNASTTVCGTKLVCIDVDSDGFGDPADCTGILPTTPTPVGWAENNTDCWDANPAGSQTFPGAAENESATTCMKDDDLDGYGDDDPQTNGAPAGVTAGSDCDDNSNVAADTFPGSAETDSLTACMKDSDADGYGDNSPAVTGVTPGTDCDDGDNASLAICGPVEVCADADGDTFGDPSDCIGILPTDPTPAGYVGNNEDCWDDAVLGAGSFPGSSPNDSATLCMKDDDGDDYGDHTPPAAAPAVIPGTDCNDLVISIVRCMTVFAEPGCVEAQVGDDVVLDATVLAGNPAFTYAWTESPDNGILNDPSLEDPTAINIQDTTSFEITVTDSTLPTAQTATDTVTIVVDQPFFLGDAAQCPQIQYPWGGTPNQVYTFNTGPTPPAGSVSTSTQNARGSVLSCTREAQDLLIRGSIQVNTAADDDQIGFVWGLQANDSNYYVLSWKQAGQTFNNNTHCNPNHPAPVGATSYWPGGIVIKRIDAVSIAATSEQDVVCDYDTLDSTVLLSPTDTGVPGWKDFVTYSITLEYKAAQSIITIDDPTIPNQGAGDVAGEPYIITVNDTTYPSGRFGTFDMSQNAVVNGPWSANCIP